MTALTERQAHWDERYRTVGAASVSWYEPQATTSLRFIDRQGPSPAVIDVGGGASPLTAELQRRGFTDLTVLDVSQVALDEARRLVDHPEDVRWIRSDLLAWIPDRQWAVWHDRAVFHFLTDPADRVVYRARLRAAVEPGGTVIIGTFAEDGPETCSGLPVRRYGPDELIEELGPDWTEMERARTDHSTPSGGHQPFTWIAARRSA